MGTLATQVAEAEVRRSELEEKVLEIEEKEDNHIAYLEAQLEGLSILDDPHAKRRETWSLLEKDRVQ